MEAEIGLMHLQGRVYWNPQKTGEASRAWALSGNTNMPTFRLRILSVELGTIITTLKQALSGFLVMQKRMLIKGEKHSASLHESCCVWAWTVQRPSVTWNYVSSPVSHSEISSELTPLTEGSLAGRRGSLCMPIPGLWGFFSASWSSVMGMLLPHTPATMSIAISSLPWWIATLENLEPE